jgi:hypothetical protein
MTAEQLFFNLAERGFVLQNVDDRLGVSPASRLTADDRQSISMHQPSLLLLLKAALKCFECGGDRHKLETEGGCVCNQKLPF